MDAVNGAVTAAIEPLNQKLDDQATKIEKQSESIQKLQIDQAKMILDGVEKTKASLEPLMQKIEENNKSTQTISNELSRIKTHNQESEWGWTGGFLSGIVLILVVGAFFYWLKFM